MKGCWKKSAQLSSQCKIHVANIKSWEQWTLDVCAYSLYNESRFWSCFLHKISPREGSMLALFKVQTLYRGLIYITQGSFLGSLVAFDISGFRGNRRKMWMNECTRQWVILIALSKFISFEIRALVPHAVCIWLCYDLGKIH